MDRTKLSKLDQKKLSDYLELPVESMTDEVVGHLRARRAYLTEKEEATLKDAFERYEKNLKKKKEEEDKKGEVSLDELKERGEKVGLIYKPGTKKVDYQKLVEEAEKNN